MAILACRKHVVLTLMAIVSHDVLVPCLVLFWHYKQSHCTYLHRDIFYKQPTLYPEEVGSHLTRRSSRVLFVRNGGNET